MTYAVMGKCARTGELGVALATGAVNVGKISPLSRGLVPTYTDGGAIVMPHGNASSPLAHLTLDLLEQGGTLDDVKREVPKIDPFFSHRQLNVLTARGDMWIYTGEDAHPHASHHIDDDGWAVSGNVLTGPEVVEAMVKSMTASADEPLGERLLQALEAGRDAGGQTGRLGNGAQDRSGILYVVDGKTPWPVTDLRIDYHPGAVMQLRKLFGYTAQLEWFFPVMWERPDTFWEEAERHNYANMPPLD